MVLLQITVWFTDKTFKESVYRFMPLIENLGFDCVQLRRNLPAVNHISSLLFRIPIPLNFALHVFTTDRIHRMKDYWIIRFPFSKPVY